MPAVVLNGHAVNKLILLMLEEAPHGWWRTPERFPALMALYALDPKETGRDPDEVFEAEFTEADLARIRGRVAAAIAEARAADAEPASAETPRFFGGLIAAMAAAHRRDLRALGAAFGLEGPAGPA